jgi:mannose-6-phosphate isomerase-like protein (cupin superfamily)
MSADSGRDILRTYLHVQDGAAIAPIEAGDAFWPELAGGGYPELDRGRLMSAFTFSGAWETWERHPAGEELVMLLSGTVTLMLESPDGVRSVRLTTPGSYVLVPPNTWHTASAKVESSLLFLTPGAGTEHRPA